MFKSDIDKSKSNSNIFEHKLYLNSSIFDANYLRSYTEMGWIGMEFANLLTHPTREEGVLTNQVSLWGSLAPGSRCIHTFFFFTKQK